MSDGKTIAANDPLPVALITTCFLKENKVKRYDGIWSYIGPHKMETHGVR